MALDKLQAILQDLEDELASRTNVEDDVRKHLEEVIAEIRTAIQHEDTDQLESDTLSTRLTDAADRFESSHPTLFGLIGRIVDVLGQLGI